MPVEPRPSDQFTRDNLLIGFPVVEFTPSLPGGGFGSPVPLGILSGASLQKEIETLALERGDAGIITVDREIVSRLAVSFQVETFNFRQDIAQYIFAAASLSAITANPAQSASSLVTIPGTNPFDTFLGLDHGEIDESSVAVTFSQIQSEAVGTGDGVLGGTQGDFALRQKIKAIGDVTSFLVNGVEEVGNLVAGSTPTSGQIAIEIGEEDSLATGSGAITFGSSKIPGNGHAIVATYTPSFSTGASDIVNLTDFVLDPLLGRIRFRNAGADASPFRLAADVGSPTLSVAYNYNRRASTEMKPFTQGGGAFSGKASIKQLSDLGVNFTWDVPSAQVRITDDELTFGAEDFATAALLLSILDAGGSDRFGTLRLSSEVEAGA